MNPPGPKAKGDADARATAWRRLGVSSVVFAMGALVLIALAHLAPEEPQARFDSAAVRPRRSVKTALHKAQGAS